MKISKSILLSALFFAFTAVAASAAPAPEVAPNDAAPAVEAQPADLFGASVLSQSADCGGAKGATTVSLNPNICGSCSQVACRGVGVNGVCGSGAGGLKYCRNWSGSLCTDGGAHCVCTNAIEP